MVAQQLPVTLLIALYSVLISTCIAVPLGIVTASSRQRWIDAAARVVSLGGLALPNVWVALLTMLLLLRLFRWSPPVIYSSPLQNLREHLQIVVFPVLLLSWELSSHLLRTVRESVGEALSGAFATAERARGLSERRLIWIHAARHAVVPTVTVIGLQFGTLLGGAVVLETVFGLPGIGRGLVQAAVARDYPYVQSVSLLLVVLFLTVNLMADAFQTLLDPRIRLSQRRLT
jgi:peptide/nickel transport system permease protein